MSGPLTPLDRLVRERIASTGPLRYAEVVETALYDAEHGFYATGGRAGRRGDFLTSPEVGPLFGALVAEAVDREWERCGEPAAFTVIDAGAGPGTLARSVAAASPRCAGALEYVAVERSATQRARHPEGVRSVGSMPERRPVGVVLANELLDNLPFQPVVEVDGVWHQIDVGLDGDELVEVVGELTTDPVLDGIEGTRYISQPAAATWLASALDGLGRGSVVVIDYGRSDSSAVEVRTYREHGRGADPLVALGSQDITVDVDFEQLGRRVRPPDESTTQAAWLDELGLDALVATGRAAWTAGAGSGGLDALRGRSRIREAEALCDPAGMGGFTVARWAVN